MRARIAAILVGLAGCGAQVPVAAPQALDLASEARQSEPESAPGICWARDVLPAVIETETVTREVAPGSFRSESRQRMVRDTSQIWVRTPCYDQLTPDTILTLQRALRARGYYLGPLDGVLEGETMTSVRRFQEDHGLDTKVLSLRAAQMLGLVLTPVPGATAG